MKLVKVLASSLLTPLAILSIGGKAVLAQETCIIWQAQNGSDCDTENLDTTLRARNSLQFISPNHGNVLQQFTITIYNPNESVGQITVNQDKETIFEGNINPGMNEFDVSVGVGKVRVSVVNGSFELSTLLNVVGDMELPISSPDSLYDAIANVEFMLKSGFYGEAYASLNLLQNEHPDSYEVWAAMAVLHRELGNEVLMRESAAKAITLLPESTDKLQKIQSILNVI